MTTDSIPSIEQQQQQPNQTLGMIMEAASALSSIGGDMEDRNGDSAEPAGSEKPTDYDLVDGRNHHGSDAQGYTGEESKTLDSAKDDLDDASAAGSAMGSKLLTGDSEQPEGTSAKKTQDMFITEDPEEQPKRYLPDNKKPDAAPTFPEKVSLSWSATREWMVHKCFRSATRCLVPSWRKEVEPSQLNRYLTLSVA